MLKSFLDSIASINQNPEIHLNTGQSVLPSDIVLTGLSLGWILVGFHVYVLGAVIKRENY